MSISKTERRIISLSITGSSHPTSAPTHSIDEIIHFLKDSYDAGKATVILNDDGSLPGYSEDDDYDHQPGSDNRNALYIADFEIDDEKKLAKILINRGDPDTPAQALVNPNTQTVDIPELPEGFVPGNSAHLLIGFHEDHGFDQSFRALLERSPGVSRTLVFKFLNNLLRGKAYELGLEYKNAQKKKSPYRPRLKSAPYASRTLAQDLKAGYATSLELIFKKQEFAGTDVDDKITSISKRIRIGLQKTSDEGVLKRILSAIRKDDDLSGFEELQIHLGGLGKNTGSASPKFLVEQEEAFETIYARIETLDGFPEHLEQAYSQICTDIITKFVPRLNDNTLWPK